MTVAPKGMPRLADSIGSWGRPESAGTAAGADVKRICEAPSIVSDEAGVRVW